MGFLLPNIEVPDGKLKVVLEFGFSSKNSDIDNGTKPILDILQKAYGFNDNKVYELVQRKKIVDKGDEYFKFKITELKNNE